MLPDNTLFALNIALNIYNLIIGTLILAYVSIKKNKNTAEKWFMLILVTNVIMIISDSLTFICSGDAKPWYFIVHPVAMYVFYSCTYLIVCSYIYYVANFLGYDMKERIRNHIVMACNIIYYTLLFTTPFTNALFTFDENNIYSRGVLFSIPALIEIVLYLLILTIFFKTRKKYTKESILPLLSFIFLPIFMQIIQFFFYGISLVNVGYSFAFIVIFINTNLNLEKDVVKKASEISKKEKRIVEIQEHTIVSLSNLVENRDTDTGEHVLRTSAYVEILARQCLKDGLFTETIDKRYIDLLRKAAPMHDIGKIVVSDAVLKKPARLTDEEFSEMKRHAAEGGRIVLEVLDDFDDPDYIRLTTEVASYHHEKYNGSGYPFGLRGDDIPLSARIMAIADVFDALVSPRVYKDPMSYDMAFGIIEKDAGSHFDPVLASEFLKIKEDVIAINEDYNRKSVKK